MAQNPSLAYQTQALMTASPAQLVAMLYDRAITSLNEAVRAIEEGDIERRWKANKRAMDILAHMEMTLDIERGGEIAGNLDKLFRFLLARLPQVDIRNDPTPAREAVQILEPLRRSWHELADSAGGNRGGSADGAPGRPAAPMTHALLSA